MHHAVQVPVALVGDQLKHDLALGRGRQDRDAAHQLEVEAVVVPRFCQEVKSGSGLVSLGGWDEMMMRWVRGAGKGNWKDGRGTGLHIV